MLTLIPGAKEEEAEDLDLEWEDVANRSKTQNAKNFGKASPKKKLGLQQQQGSILQNSVSAEKLFG
jgi:hypothetical protein